MKLEGLRSFVGCSLFEVLLKLFSRSVVPPSLLASTLLNAHLSSRTSSTTTSSWYGTGPS